MVDHEQRNARKKGEKGERRSGAMGARGGTVRKSLGGASRKNSGDGPPKSEERGDNHLKKCEGGRREKENPLSSERRGEKGNPLVCWLLCRPTIGNYKTQAEDWEHGEKKKGGAPFPSRKTSANTDVRYNKTNKHTWGSNVTCRGKDTRQGC